jgi:putative ABC transport system permease protein
MFLLALKMLVGDTGKYLGMIFGVSFAALLMTQQGAIFWGLMSRTYGFIEDAGSFDVWVMDKQVQHVDDRKPLRSVDVLRVRGIEGVEWAVPMFKSLVQARVTGQTFQSCNLVGLDDATMIGGPPEMLEGKLEDLRRTDAVIVDINGAQGLLAKVSDDGKTKTPIKVGDTLELNDRRALVVGICRVTRTFQSQPVIFTTYSRAVQYAPSERNALSFVLVKAKPGQPLDDLCKRITTATNRAAYTRSEFENKTLTFWMKNTGIPINFGISVLLGFIVGAAICGQTFYQFTADNLKHFGALKAMGATNFKLLGMILLQALVVGLKGYGLGVGLAALFGWRMGNGKAELAFTMTPQLLVLTAIATTLIMLMSAALSLSKVLRLEPAIVFKG